MAWTEDEVYQALKRRIGKQPDPAIWDHLLEEKTYVDDAIHAESLDELVKKYRALAALQAKGKGKPKSGAREVPPDARLTALAKAAADDASRRSDVTAFRAKVLGGKLLTHSKVAAWVEGQADADGTPQPLLTVTVPEGHTVSDVEVAPAVTDFSPAMSIWPEPPITISKRNPAVGFTLLLLEYSSAGKGGVMRKRIRPFGVLDGLRVLGETLATEYGWEPYQATAFVLTGIPPYIPKAKLTFSTKVTSMLGLQTRILIEVDSSMPPMEVLKMYRAARAEVPLGGNRKRYRSMTDKHVRLAEFFEANGRQWKERMKTWNLEYPEWSYSEVRNFSRDCKRASERLFGEGG